MNSGSKLTNRTNFQRHRAVIYCNLYMSLMKQTENFPKTFLCILSLHGLLPASSIIKKVQNQLNKVFKDHCG